MKTGAHPSHNTSMSNFFSGSRLENAGASRQRA
jgi:hypothetical protein